jgi:methionyl aminopeptidase
MRFKMRWKPLRSRILSLISVSSGMVFHHSRKMASKMVPVKQQQIEFYLGRVRRMAIRPEGWAVSIKTAEELAGMRVAGLIVRRTLEVMKRAVRPGVTTAEVDEAGAKVIRELGARPAAATVYGFPGVNLISVNNEVVHGIPGARIIREGDLVKLDVTIEKDGFMADAAITLGVGTISEEKSRLMACAKRAFHNAMKVARTGVRVAEIGGEIEREVRRSGFSVIRELAGHGIGRTIHEEPSILNYLDRNIREILTDGLAIAVEPIIAAGSGKVFLAADGWTVQTTDGGVSAHYEHTLVITNKEPILLTAA